MSAEVAERGVQAGARSGFSHPLFKAKALHVLHGLVAFWVFSGFFVFVEPSPYELAFILVLGGAIFAGMSIYRSTLGLLAITVLFTPFAIIAAFQVRNAQLLNALVFAAVTIFLLLTSYFAANYVAEDTSRRMRLIVKAYTIAAVIAALIGTLAYLQLIPGAEIFTRYGRAKATFKDPNVYGPFLVLPAMYALQRILLLRDWRRVLIASAIYLLIFIGLFVSFSRAAWLHLAGSSALVLVLVFVLEAQTRDRVRIILLSLAGALMLLVALAGLLSIPQVSALFETRTASQDYDTGETGRFGRQAYAIDVALSNPWGIGAGEFATMRIIEEPHNMYVSTVHVYGWGGGALFYVLIFWTLAKGVSALARPSPYRLFLIPVMGTYVVVVLEAVIIDADHWRHLYLLIGLIWGLSSAIKLDQRRTAPRAEMLP